METLGCASGLDLSLGNADVCHSFPSHRKRVSPQQDLQCNSRKAHLGSVLGRRPVNRLSDPDGTAAASIMPRAPPFSSTARPTSRDWRKVWARLDALFSSSPGISTPPSGLSHHRAI